VSGLGSSVLGLVAVAFRSKIEGRGTIFEVAEVVFVMKVIILLVG
jgi:hypothetical protein